MTLNEKHTACSECEEARNCWSEVYSENKESKYILYCKIKEDYVCNIEQCDKWDKWVKRMAKRIKQEELWYDGETG